jgi:uncharacterized protein YbjT (DUF2867 family)
VARRALVTGATGFVGGRLAAALAERGWEVRCLVRDRSRAPQLADRGFEIHEADVLDAKTQAIAIDDVIAYLVAAPDVPASAGREIQIAGPEILSYGEMLDRMADALGVRRRPRLPVPFITPRLSSLWIGLATPVDARIARPLVEGLSTPTIVTDRSGAELFDIHPMPLMDALRRALAEDRDAQARAG